MFGLPVIDIITIAAYFLAVIAIGIWASRRIHNQEDFFLGGRRFGKFIQTFAAFGQSTSVESAVTMSVMTARNGVAGIFTNLIWVVTVPVYWITSIWYRRMRVLTLGDFFEERYNSRGIAALYALASAAFFIIVIGFGLFAMAKTISGITPKPVTALTVTEHAEYNRATDLMKLEQMDFEKMNPEQLRQLEQLRLENPRKEFSYINEKILVWVVACIVLLYAGAGGLEAAFLTDTLQGVFTLILAVLLFPFAIFKINSVFGGHGLMGVVDIARSRLPQVFFELWGSPAIADFTWYYIIALLVMGQINAAVQANQLVACGSAKDENTARIGFTTGIYMKRACGLLWGVTALLLVILYSGVVKNPDYLWGYACRDLLGPLNIGLLGLMIACLMAALMSMADALMLTTSSLLTHNFFRPFFPGLTEKAYVWVGRICGVLTILAAAVIANYFDSIWQIMKLIWEFNVIVAAPFWLGVKWYRANKYGAWASMITASVFFIILSVAIPIIPGVRTNPYLQKTNKPITVVRKYIVRQADVLQRKEQINEWKKLSAMGKAEGSEPVPLEVGQEYEKEYTTPAKAIFWTQGLKTDKNGRVAGAGMLSLEMVLLDYIGIDMTNNPKALNETIRISIRTVAPFLILVIVSLLTKPEDRERLNGFFAKMKTPVCADKDKDAVELALSYQNPGRFNYKKMFPKSSWEFEKFSRYDIKGIVWFSLGGVLLLYLLYLVSQIGA